MYDIRQFKPALYVLLLLGISGFALAAESPGIWALSLTAIIVNAWLVRTGQFRPVPMWLATIFTVIVLVILAAPLRADPTRAVLVIGEFLVTLQIVKLFEQRANRDYAQLLVLSLLLMVAASINTASLLFGVILCAYLFLSLYCCLLFHLKVETDAAKAAAGVPESKLNPVTLRQDRRYLSKSMRRLTAVVSAVAVITAVIIFLFFPRGAGAGMLSPLQFRPSESLSGFSDTVSFQKIAQISQNSEEIGWVKLYKDGQLVGGTEPLLLRGIALDVYTGDDPTLGPSRRWQRSPDEYFREPVPGHDLRIAPDHPRWRQEISFNPTGTNVIFAIAGVCSCSGIGGLDSVVRYFPRDDLLQSSETITARINYVVESTGRMSDSVPADQDDGGGDSSMVSRTQRASSHYDKAIEDFARRPEVSGTDANGSLALRRRKDVSVDLLDPVIAENISNYLRENFTYTLDLTDAKAIGDRDPLVAFLYDFKRGHCEYFAGAMALMCQSLGMQSRVVAGFKCDEYNAILDRYIVRQSQAHAWVEVLSPTGVWQTYDPTSGRGDDGVIQNNGIWRRAVQLFQFLDYTWANRVVAYDRDSRANLLISVDRTVANTGNRGSAGLNRLRNWFSDHEHIDILASRVTSVLFVTLIGVVVLAVGWFLYEHWRLRQRARRIGLDALPASDQLRLVRQLGFYDDLLRLLERHRITRSPQMTPMEFSQSISFLPHEVFDAVRRLTRIFYRVRYGRHELTQGQQRHLSAVIADIQAALGSKTRMT